jgi:hypothetical protein
MKDYGFSKFTVWTTLDGRSIPIYLLSDVHLANIIHFVKKSLPKSERTKQMLQVLKQEAKDRGLKQAFLDSAPIPWQNVDGSWLRYNNKKGNYEVIGR